MTKYILHRILLFIPTLLAVSMIAFGLSKMSNNDPVENLCQQEEPNSAAALARQNKECQQIAADLGLDKPAFYFAFRAKAFPDSLYQIYDLNERIARQNLIAQYGNWSLIEVYFRQLYQLNQQVLGLPDSLSNDLVSPIKSGVNQLNIHYEHERIHYFLEEIAATIQQNATLKQQLYSSFQNVVSVYSDVRNRPTKGLLYIPTIHGYGLDNQYHHWISNFLTGDFGISYYDRRPVATRIWEAVQWTLIINIASIILAYLIAIPLGVFSAKNRGNWKDQMTSTFLFMLYALPSFWVATMLIVFVTTSEYNMDFFPTGGVGNLKDTAPFWDRFWETVYHLILPVFCVTYTSLAFIARQMRGSLVEVLDQDFIKTAKAKGLSTQKTIWKHAFRNALFPIITLIASILPATLAGSLIIEVIFGIPGMGRLAYEALFQSDWPVVYTVLMLAAILTMIGMLLADIFYTIADPRVRLSKSE